MLPMAGQTGGPNGLKCFLDSHGRPGYSKPKRFKIIFLKFLKNFFSSMGNAGPFS